MSSTSKPDAYRVGPRNVALPGQLHYPDRKLLHAVVSKLNRGDAPDSKFPDRKGEYWALCPLHPDRHTGSFSVSSRGYHCFACGASGSVRGLAKYLGIA
jgi:hypothetical protein